MAELKMIPEPIDKFEYHDFDFDQSGIMYYLGTNCGKNSQWVNPMDLGFVEVTSSTLNSTSKPLNAVVGRSSVRCVTNSASQVEQWIVIRLKEHVRSPLRVAFVSVFFVVVDFCLLLFCLIVVWLSTRLMRTVCDPDRVHPSALRVLGCW